MTAALFRCALSSKHFEFEVFGSSEADALALFAAGIRQHAREYRDVDPQWLKEAIAEARAQQVTAGVFTRDGEALKIEAPEPAQAEGELFVFEIWRTVTGQESVYRTVRAASREEAEAKAAELCDEFNDDCPDDILSTGGDSFGDFEFINVTGQRPPEED